MKQEPKPFWQSKTFWFNVLALVVTVAGAFGYRQFQPSPDVGELALGIVALVNIILRFVTKRPVRWK